MLCDWTHEVGGEIKGGKVYLSLGSKGEQGAKGTPEIAWDLNLTWAATGYDKVGWTYNFNAMLLIIPSHKEKVESDLFSRTQY